MTVTITRSQIQELTDAIGDDDDLDVRENYSGRGMYGATCVGFVHDCSAFALGVALGAILGDDALELRAESDSMGRSEITYFRNLVIATDDDE